MLTAHGRMANVITIEKSTVCGVGGDVFLFVRAAVPPVWFVFVSGLFLRSVGVVFFFFLLFVCCRVHALLRTWVVVVFPTHRVFVA